MADITVDLEELRRLVNLASQVVAFVQVLHEEAEQRHAVSASLGLASDLADDCEQTISRLDLIHPELRP